MQRDKLLSIVLFLALAALSAWAADVDGQWVAQVPGRNGDMETTFKFKVSGQQLTGSMENQFGEREIANGKVSGDDISFTVHIEFNGNDVTFLYAGKAAGNEIKFTRERKGGDLGPAKVEFTAKRKT